MKLNNKHKSKVRRQVDIDLGVKAPKTIIFTSKKIYTRKSKHKNNEREIQNSIKMDISFNLGNYNVQTKYDY